MMAPLRTSQARTRLRRPLPKATFDPFDDSDQDEHPNTPRDDEPPLKRIRTSRSSAARSKWIPGGRGGGGRHIDMEESDTVAVTPRSVDEYNKSRSRAGRETTQKMTNTPRTSTRSRNRAPATQPRYSTAAAATAAAAHGDGYKPREERGWEEFHPDLDLDADFAIIPSEEVDGLVKKSRSADEGDTLDGDGFESNACGATTPTQKRAGRPPRRQDSMLHAILTPTAPKIVPVPGPNPRERLTLPKPSYRELDPFLSYEHKDIAQVNFVDKTMANVGYQESEVFLRPDRIMIRQMEGSAEEDLDLSPDLIVNGENSAIGGSGVGRVEYDMDEQDVKWLEAFNKTRTKDGVAIIKPAIFEVTMTKIEKEWHALEKRIPKPNPKAPQTQRPRSSSAAAVNGEPAGEEPDSKCAICDDGDCENANAIVFCDGCDLAVHQECYGVPYIPEGQWLCRKCQLVGNSRPSCIFCPNEGGAFKQTNNSKWAHLFCAIWIPEVTIGNPSLMEPITDVEKVPPSRWKLSCYICKQDMGASIQCSDGRCYEPFHLTCARQAGLYLRMKTGGGQNTLMEPSHLRAYCHKHTPADWRAEHNTDKAFDTATKYFREHFRGQVWADSRASALAINEGRDNPNAEKGVLKVTLTNRKGQKQKTIWRLPSGAPVIPEVILKSIEDSLVRFSVQKKKEYVSETCKYWTLKREARRGAALLKRLQLQMDTFSSFEVTRRDYKAQGAAGRARLDRRIEFAEMLAVDLERIQQICALIKEREAAKLKDALILRDIVDTVYFPLTPLLEPILEKAFKHDKGVYRQGLLNLQYRLINRHYTTVAAFSSDFVQIFNGPLNLDVTTFGELVGNVTGRAEDMPTEQRDRRTLARRIVKAVEHHLESAIRKEAELHGRPYAQQMKEMDDALLSRRGSLAESIDVPMIEATEVAQTNGIASPDDQDIEMQDVNHVDEKAIAQQAPSKGGKREVVSERILLSTAAALLGEEAHHAANTPPASTNGVKHDGTTNHSTSTSTTRGQQIEPPSPPMSLEGPLPTSVSQGGIPWYVAQFDPVGTTIYEERWTGPEVLRDMSEELSEMDEDELQGLGGGDELETDEAIDETEQAEVRSTKSSPLKKKALLKKGKRTKSNDWGTRSFRHRRW